MTIQAGFDWVYILLGMNVYLYLARIHICMYGSKSVMNANGCQHLRKFVQTAQRVGLLEEMVGAAC